MGTNKYLTSSVTYFFHLFWFLAVAGLSGCSDKSSTPIANNSPDTQIEQIETKQEYLQSSIASCSFDIIVGDYLKFNINEMWVKKSCGTISINLKHEGKLAANMMGHNWVLTKTSDVTEIAADGISAGLANDYVNVKDNRILAWTKIIGGGEETSISLSTKELIEGSDYTFFCSFPGHSYGMRGQFYVKS
tara:strand:- start:114 stop:683 length:570 start_codon:yes stop_codon:yes gene_type:complete